MKRLFKQSQRVVKGTSRAVLLSILIHVGLFLLAGMLVVFSVVKKTEQKFEPPKAIERPKMKLRKPKVKIKKTAKPKPTTRIVTKVNRASLPDIELPEMTGMGEGLGSGFVGGFDLMPDIKEESMLGGDHSVGNDFVGTFYDFNRNSQGRPQAMDPETMFQSVARFVRNGWNTAEFSRYYRSPVKLYSTFFCVPTELSTLGPAAFGEPDASSWCWIVHYKGELVFNEDVTLRFWGQGDDYMIVRVDGEEVLVATWPQGPEPYFSQIWTSSSADTRKYPMASHKSVVGDWITLKAGESKQMEVIIGEGRGGLFAALLAVEIEGVEYPQSRYMGGPVLPIFRTDEIGRDMAEGIHYMLHEGDAAVTNGPIFRDFEPHYQAGYEEVAAGEAPASELSAVPADEPSSDPSREKDELREWISVKGNTMKAKYLAWVGGNVVVETERGKQKKIPFAQLSAADQTFVELANPPEFDIAFSKLSNQVLPPKKSPFVTLDFPTRFFDYNFGVKLKKTSTKPYNHELRIEYFAIGDERDGDNRILLQRHESRFTPAGEYEESYSFSGKPVRVESKSIWPDAPLRGIKYSGYLIVVSDENGRIVQYRTSSENLYELLDILREFPVGKRFDRQGNRTWPPRPTEADRNPWVFR